MCGARARSDHQSAGLLVELRVRRWQWQELARLEVTTVPVFGSAEQRDRLVGVLDRFSRYDWICRAYVMHCHQTYRASTGSGSRQRCPRSTPGPTPAGVEARFRRLRGQKVDGVATVTTVGEMRLVVRSIEQISEPPPLLTGVRTSFHKGRFN